MIVNEEGRPSENPFTNHYTTMGTLINVVVALFMLCWIVGSYVGEVIGPALERDETLKASLQGMFALVMSIVLLAAMLDFGSMVAWPVFIKAPLILGGFYLVGRVFFTRPSGDNTGYSKH